MAKPCLASPVLCMVTAWCRTVFGTLWPCCQTVCTFCDGAEVSDGCAIVSTVHAPRILIRKQVTESRKLIIFHQS